MSECSESVSGGAGAAQGRDDVFMLFRLLFAWLAGEGEDAAIYGLTAAVARFGAEHVELAHAAALALALPVLVGPGGAVGASEELLTHALEQFAAGILGEPFGVEAGASRLSPARLSKAREVIYDALVEVGFWTTYPAVLRSVAAATDHEGRVKIGDCALRNLAAALIVNLETHLPVADDATASQSPVTTWTGAVG
jgi:hypothetical protein